MARKPKIALTMRLEDKTNRFYLGRDYSEALAGLGAIPLHLSLIPDKNYINDALKRVDGLLLPGSDNDVDPLLYGQQPLAQLGRVVPLKDQTDLLAIAAAKRLKIPILGICYGMQALNVAAGGTLWQDINHQIPDSVKHQQGVPLDRNSHTVKTEQGSLIAKLAGKTAIEVNSHHHQAVNRLGKGLNATSCALDGVVESIEGSGDQFILGVQWHPELSWETDLLSKAIFENFVAAAKGHAENTLS
jgi:putative glutamine amidotransferase